MKYLGWILGLGVPLLVAAVFAATIHFLGGKSVLALGVATAGRTWFATRQRTRPHRPARRAR